MIIDYYSYSSKGDRAYNEDYVRWSVKNEKACFVLNDGLGGHGKGDVAAKTVAESIIRSFEDNDNTHSFFHYAYTKAERELEEIQINSMEKYSMKTTSVSLLIDGENASWCHIGDSRLYYFQKGTLIQRTMDHSVPQMLVYAGEIRDEDIRFHEDRNRLLKAMGNNWEDFEATLSETKRVKKGQDFLLCTDGFWEYITEDDMTAYLHKSRTAREWIEKMADHVAKRGEGRNRDNASVIAVRLL